MRLSISDQWQPYSPTLHRFLDIASFFVKNSHPTPIPREIWGSYTLWPRSPMLGFRRPKTLG